VRPAFFFDRDGVLIEEVDLLTEPAQLRLLPGVVEALRTIDERGYPAVVVTNQTVVARGMIDESELERLHDHLREMLLDQGAPPLRAIYACPHHPHADVARYRVQCACRKPKPGMLLRAAADLRLDLTASFMVGDRLSDVAAGASAGCTTVLVSSGAHSEPPIVGMPEDPPEPDHRAEDLLHAVRMLLGGVR